MDFSTVDIDEAEKDIKVLLKYFYNYSIDLRHSEPQDDLSWKTFQSKFKVNNHHHEVKSILDTLKHWKGKALITFTVVRIYEDFSR